MTKKEDMVFDALVKEAVYRYMEEITEKNLDNIPLHDLTPQQDKKLQRRLFDAHTSKRRRISWKAVLVAVLTATALTFGTLEALGIKTVINPILGEIQKIAMYFSPSEQTTVYTADGVNAETYYSELNEKIGGSLLVPAWMPAGTVLKSYLYEAEEQCIDLVYEFAEGDEGENTLSKLRILQQANETFDPEAFRVELEVNVLESEGEAIKIIGQEARRYQMTLESGDTCVIIAFQTPEFTYLVAFTGVDRQTENKILNGLEIL